jgi:hypothetical protein
MTVIVIMTVIVVDGHGLESFGGSGTDGAALHA